MEDLLPREKALKYGISSLNNNELLALILKSAYKDKNVFKMSEELIELAGGFSKLPTLTYEELIQVKGIKKAKAMELLAILEVSKRLSKFDSISERKNVNLDDLIKYLRLKIGFKSQEEFFVIYLNGLGKIIKDETLFKGTSDRSIVGIDEIFRKALLIKARAIVIAHNHPSGDCRPSSCDIEITKQVNEAGKLMGIVLLDHIIISFDNYYSFKREGLLC